MDLCCEGGHPHPSMLPSGAHSSPASGCTPCGGLLLRQPPHAGGECAPHFLPSWGHYGPQPVVGLCSRRHPPRPPSLQLPLLWLLAELFGFAGSCFCVSGRGWNKSCFSSLTGLLFGESGGTTGFLGKGLKRASPAAGKALLHRGVRPLGFRSQLRPLPAVWPWVTYLTSLGFGFQEQLIFMFLISVL